jgi:ubiquinone/menaquinone biosynthesis C-methylase UbiE
LEKTHRNTVKKEFSKQVKSLESARFFTDQEILEKIKNESKLSEKMTILDAGCGPGIVTEALAPQVKEIVAYDLTPAMIEATRTRCEKAGLQNVRYQAGLIESLPYGNDFFERVISRLVVHHLPEPQKAFTEIKRVLKKDGMFILADIISSEDAQKANLHNALEGLRDPSHSRMLPQSELINVLEKAGFDVSVAELWVNEREFKEWIAITNSPERIEPIKTVMAELANCGNDAGVNLRVCDETIFFDHKWILITATK